MKDSEFYRGYDAKDFIDDEEIRHILQGSDPNVSVERLISILPGKEEEIKLAMKILRGLRLPLINQPPERREELWQEILVEHRKSQRFPRYFAIAASFLLLIGLGGTILYNSIKQKPEVVIAVNKTPAKASLILSDGKTLSFGSAQSSVHYLADGKGILLNDSAGITRSEHKEGLDQLIVPFGKRADLTLSDGTRVFLNSGSKLIFPSLFDGNSREVTLEGEAYFEVTADKEKPFFVRTEAFNVKVYGTKFNIQSYNSDESSNIVLVEGKVSMDLPHKKNSKEIFLEPNQQFSINRGESNFEITRIDNPGQFTAWVEGYLTFNNDDIISVLRRVSRYYNVEIETVLPEKREKIYGKLVLKDNMERVLDGISFISKTKYHKQADKYIFMVE